MEECFETVLCHCFTLQVTQACTVRQRADLKFSGRHVIEQIQTVRVCAYASSPASACLSGWMMLYTSARSSSRAVFSAGRF